VNFFLSPVDSTLKASGSRIGGLKRWANPAELLTPNSLVVP
jgi:hypothetical protein